MGKFEITYDANPFSKQTFRWVECVFYATLLARHGYLEQASARGWEAVALPGSRSVYNMVELAEIEMKLLHPWRAWKALEQALAYGYLTSPELFLLMPRYRSLSERYFPSLMITR